jgi:hypothetical protein
MADWLAYGLEDAYAELGFAAKLQAKSVAAGETARFEPISDPQKSV